MAFEDRTLECRDCGGEFAFSIGEQEFFNERRLTNDPVRCAPCRAARRRTRAGVGEYAQQLYPVVCAECGTHTELPFEPKLGTPVYCKDCFAVVRSK
jgi:CxxC-x17-CxxC domain-containing protein